MANTKQMDSQLLTDKETIRKNIRNSLAYKSAPPILASDLVGAVFEPIDNLFTTFVENFRKAGGKYIPCTTQNMVKYLVKITQGQHYRTLLNTSPNLSVYLDKYNVRHVNTVDLREPVDAALFFSDILVARNGAIGFTQSVAQYASVRNLAKDIIVVSRGRCIFPDMEQALEYQVQRNGNKTCPLVEFLAPTIPEEINGTLAYSPRSPSIILMLIEENQPQPQKQEEPVEAANPSSEEISAEPANPTATPSQCTIDFTQNTIPDESENQNAID